MVTNFYAPHFPTFLFISRRRFLKIYTFNTYIWAVNVHLKPYTFITYVFHKWIYNKILASVYRYL